MTQLLFYVSCSKCDNNHQFAAFTWFIFIDIHANKSCMLVLVVRNSVFSFCSISAFWMAKSAKYGTVDPFHTNLQKSEISMGSISRTFGKFQSWSQPRHCSQKTVSTRRKLLRTICKRFPSTLRAWIPRHSSFRQWRK